MPTGTLVSRVNRGRQDLAKAESGGKEWCKLSDRLAAALAECNRRGVVVPENPPPAIKLHRRGVDPNPYDEAKDAETVTHFTEPMLAQRLGLARERYNSYSTYSDAGRKASREIDVLYAEYNRRGIPIPAPDTGVAGHTDEQLAQALDERRWQSRKRTEVGRQAKRDLPLIEEEFRRRELPLPEEEKKWAKRVETPDVLPMKAKRGR